MKRRGLRLGTILLVAVVALVMLGGITFLARSIIGNGGNSGGSSNDNQGSVGQTILSNPGKNATIAMSVRGPVVAQENHYDIDLKITSSSRNLVIYRGYDRKKVIKRIDLDNSDKAFSDLSLALNNNGFMNESKGSATKNNGLCASGQLIDFRVSDGDKSQDLWTTSCGTGLGNFSGRSSTVVDLLLNQIPGSRQAIAEAKNQ